MPRLIVHFICFISFAVSAQDTVKLREVEIQDRASEFIRQQAGITFDSLTLSKYNTKNLAELLSENSPVFIKSYGNGALSTISIRGTSSVHTSVLWNGIPVNLQSTGDMDLSLVPSGAFDRIRLVHGGSSSIYGSGSVGGNIMLESSPHFGKKSSISINSLNGSFGKQEYSGTLLLNSENASFSLTGYLKNNKNLFSFHNHALEGNPLMRMENAAVSGKGITSSFFYKFKRSVISAHAWMEGFTREIPAQVYSPVPYAASQEDLNLRSLLEYKFYGNSYLLDVKAAMINGFLSYLDTVTHIDSRTETTSFFPEISLTKRFKKGTLTSGINSNLSFASNTNYSKRQSRKNLAFFSGYSIPLNKYVFSVHAREDLYDGNLNAFTFNTSASRQLWNSLELNLNGGRTFRAPSLNDLYWVPGGNPSLKPEEGWFGQAGIKAEKKSRYHHISGNATVYVNYIDNWIIWLPVSTTIWTPRNLKKVLSKGIELYVKDEFNMEPFRIVVRGSYAYTEASNESSEDPGIVLHDQIIYIPYYTATGSFDLIYKSFNLHCNQSFTGGRYITSDHTAALPYYMVTSIRADYRIKIKSQSVNLFVSVNNLLNTSYQVIEHRPMPGRGYEAGITLNLIQP